ncbi:MAG: 3-isopropylmalate dehydratase [Candidatus Aminicenantes bacterium]|nr:MAG: 3-isopropylmalate dehydratase [Candidatus Aminicenantes bacterium]
MTESVFSGRIWVLQDNKGRLLADIDTDQIYHNAHLHIIDISQMGQHALGNLEGWKDFPQKVRPGDILITGRNFGAGSSRQQAVDCFISLKMGLILAPSFGAIYFRNAVNSGFPLLRCPVLDELVAKRILETGDEIRVNALSGEGSNISKKIPFQVESMSPVQYDIFKAGSLFHYGKKASG